MNHKQLIELIDSLHFTDCDEAKDYILSNKYAELKKREIEEVEE